MIQTEPVQWTTIPVLVKIYKLLIHELTNQIEANMFKAGKEDEDEEEEEDDWEDGDADGNEEIQLRVQTLSDLIDSMATEFNGFAADWYGNISSKTWYNVEEEKEEDPDFFKDPTYQIDLQKNYNGSSE
nr:importin-9 isoform X7 [Crassostrea gigas]XP_034317420.1 importin-9 isoform X7 [Crassostrea gigas]XP_034317421.1 importin-9 isoform X7 [Crassostrea gigas]